MFNSDTWKMARFLLKKKSKETIVKQFIFGWKVRKQQKKQIPWKKKNTNTIILSFNFSAICFIITYCINRAHLFRAVCHQSYKTNQLQINNKQRIAFTYLTTTYNRTVNLNTLPLTLPNVTKCSNTIFIITRITINNRCVTYIHTDEYSFIIDKMQIYEYQGPSTNWKCYR